MSPFPYQPFEPSNGSSAGDLPFADCFEKCHAAASSGDALARIQQDIESRLLAVGSATSYHAHSVDLECHARKLLADSDFSSLNDPVLRDIARRHHLYTIVSFLQVNPGAPFALELEDTVILLRAESAHYARLRDNQSEA